jgi:hypothetical protein
MNLPMRPGIIRAPATANVGSFLSLIKAPRNGLSCAATRSRHHLNRSVSTNVPFTIDQKSSASPLSMYA